MSTSAVPPLFLGLVDNAVICPPSDRGPLSEVLAEHRQHRHAWYAGLVDALLVPVDDLEQLRAKTEEDERPTIGVIGSVGRIRAALAGGVGDGSAGGRDGFPAGWALTSGSVPGWALMGEWMSLGVRQIEAAVARRREDPMPGLRDLLALATITAEAALPVDIYAEIPLAWGLFDALDAVAEARDEHVTVVPKFRTGGLAAELFPTPVELAEVICACRDRGLQFKLTAGLQRAVRHNDPETGLAHHGFLNVLAAAIDAAAGAELVAVAERLAATDPAALVDVIRPWRLAPRPLWTGFGSCRPMDAVRDLAGLGLLAGGARPQPA